MHNETTSTDVLRLIKMLLYEINKNLAKFLAQLYTSIYSELTTRKFYGKIYELKVILSYVKKDNLMITERFQKNLVTQ